MDGGCTFFDSEAWHSRTEAHVGHAWDLETYLRKVEDEDPQRRIADLAQNTEDSPEALAVTAVSELPVDISLQRAASVWRDEQDWIPETCPHESLEEVGRCPFHLSPDRYEEVDITSEGVTEAFRETVDPETNQNKCFVGAHLRTLPLAEERIETADNAPLDLRLATIDGELEWQNTRFEPSVTMEGAVLCSDGRTGEPAPESAANRYVSLAADIDLKGARFEESVDFKHARFGAAVSFNGAEFDDVAMFNYATFDDSVEVWATFRGKADFSKATIRGAAQLRGTFESAAIFNYTTFEDDVILWNSTFGHKAEFLAAHVEGTFDCEHATFEGTARFVETAFEGSVIFDGSAFVDVVELNRIRAPNAAISMQDAELSGGHIGLTDRGPHYDLNEATVGDVAVTCTDDSTSDPLGYLRISRTTFEGFDFSDHAASFKPDWRIDSLVNSWPTEDLDSETDLHRYERLEDTYLRAKSGATNAGHNKAASEFFVHEMRYRRKQHATLAKRRVKDRLIETPSTSWEYALAPAVGLVATGRDLLGRLNPRAWRDHRNREQTPAWQAGYRWVSNGSLGLIAGYGERPKRPLVLSVATIFVFAAVYALLGVSPTSNGPLGSGYILLSTQSFITFILGSSPVQTDFLPQLLSSIEGFMGAFFIAVFVFTLTRSIHR
jgi:uncharacterized protein YjbI with pentapeptide repeats